MTSDFLNTRGITFVVDSNDQEHVSRAREGLQLMLNRDGLRGALLDFAVKRDLLGAMNAVEVTDKLGSHGHGQRTVTRSLCWSLRPRSNAMGVLLRRCGKRVLEVGEGDIELGERLDDDP